MLVEIPERVDGAGVVAEYRRVAEQNLGLVRGAQNQMTVLFGLVEEDAHALARHLVADADPIGFRLVVLEVGIHHR